MRDFSDAQTRHAAWIEEAAALVIAVADDSGQSLVDVIIELEHYIVEETKVGMGLDGEDIPGQRQYRLVNQRLVELVKP